VADQPDPNPPRPPVPAGGRAGSAAIWLAIAVATIAGVGGIALLLKRAGVLEVTPGSPDAAVAVDDHYLVFLSQIEVESGPTGGGKWDLTDGGPDVRYDIYWRGTRIFRSSVRDDTLIARWDQEEIGLRDLVSGVSPERSSKAARITARHGETLEFRVLDSDTFVDDEIGRWEVAVDSLRTGEQVWNAPAPGIRQATCRVLRCDRTGR
jgi:hypothetical protein